MTHFAGVLADPSPDAGDRLRRRAIALQLRLAGASYQQIGQQLGVGKTQAWRDVQGALGELVTEPLEELRDLELRRLDAIILAHWERAMTDPQHALVVFRALDRRYRLLGLDRPLGRVDVRALVMELAEEEGVDPDLLMEDARRYLEAARES